MDIAGPDASDCRRGHAVVLVHGLWMGGWVMTPLAHRLHADGFAAVPFSYPSMTESLSASAADLARYVASLAVAPLHFVGHSLGGLLILRCLIDHPELPPGRVVLLGSPCLGSRAARRLRSLPLGSRLLGKALTQWLDQGPFPDMPGREVGVVAGSLGVGMGRLVAAGLPRPHDGVVAVDEARLPWARDVTVLPVSHTGLLLSRRVACAIALFLRNGRFPRGGGNG